MDQESTTLIALATIGALCIMALAMRLRQHFASRLELLSQRQSGLSVPSIPIVRFRFDVSSRIYAEAIGIDPTRSRFLLIGTIAQTPEAGIILNIDTQKIIQGVPLGLLERVPVKDQSGGIVYDEDIQDD